MHTMNTALHSLPDIARHTRANQNLTLDWVGMSGIDIPLHLEQPHPLQVNAKVDIHVDIATPDPRGIHMSRLYLALQHILAQAPLNGSSLHTLLEAALSSHAGISTHACIRLQFELPIQRAALTSGHHGWKAYPVTIDVQKGPQGLDTEIRVQVPYSSTCPCSAALSRQLLQQAFTRQFDPQAPLTVDDVSAWLLENASLATPHSQRSSAHLKVKLIPDHREELPLQVLIDQAEQTLQTAVQTAVKREDEQAFAEINGHNQMFCEDAARRLKQALLEQSMWQDFWIRIEHHESLHAHDATAICVKGVQGGFSPRLTD